MLACIVIALVSIWCFQDVDVTDELPSHFAEGLQIVTESCHGKATRSRYAKLLGERFAKSSTCCVQSMACKECSKFERARWLGSFLLTSQ